MDSTVELERGQNIFEIHIDKVRHVIFVYAIISDNFILFFAQVVLATFLPIRLYCLRKP